MVHMIGGPACTVRLFLIDIYLLIANSLCLSVWMY